MGDPRSIVRRVWASRRAIASGDWNFGHCSTCGRRTIFIEEAPWLRDHYLCLWCASIPRWRALVLVLEAEIPDWRTRRIHEFAPGGPASRRLAMECRDYTYSFYGVFGEPHEDLEALSFADCTIDIIVTQDVMEHVVDASASFAEIARVLRPGGVHVFTVPILDTPETKVRAERVDGEELRHLEPPDFHLSPEGPSLVVREWGDDICDFIDACGPTQTRRHHRVDRSLGLDGEFLDVCTSFRTAVPHGGSTPRRPDGSD